MALEAERLQAALRVAAAGGALDAAGGLEIDGALEVGVEAFFIGAARRERRAASTFAEEVTVAAIRGFDAGWLDADVVFAEAAADAGRVPEAALSTLPLDAGLQPDPTDAQRAVVVGEARRSADVVDAQAVVAAGLIVDTGDARGAGSFDADPGAALGVDEAVVEAAHPGVAHTTRGVAVEDAVGVLLAGRRRRRGGRFAATGRAADETGRARRRGAVVADQAHRQARREPTPERDEEQSDREVRHDDTDHGKTSRRGESSWTAGDARSRAASAKTSTVGR
jgi:hypothetical protein